MKQTLYLFLITFLAANTCARAQTDPETPEYKKRVLETSEVDILSSYYSQEGDNAAVSGGIGSEELTDFAPTIVVAIPLNDDDILTLDVGVSAYTSASSSNVDPFDGNGEADPFTASSGASASDVYSSGLVSYSHSSDDRNKNWSAKLSAATEYDYFSVGFGGSYGYLFNQKNTEISINANVYLDKWKIIYPIELRPLEDNGLEPLSTSNRNSYAAGLGFSQILSKNAQFSLSLDLVQQQGLLSTPFHRVYFEDRDDFFANDFQIADDIERLPDNRFKTAIGGRFNYYINETFVLRSYYRYYTDTWGIKSHTASIEVPIKLGSKFTLYPNYRYYQQTAADYFYANNQASSTFEFYSSDFDLSKFTANQYGLGFVYTDIFAKLHIGPFGLKQISLKADRYERNTGLNYVLFSGGIKFVQD